MLDDGGVSRQLAARVCRPPSSLTAAPLAVINHGAPPTGAQIRLMQPTSCAAEPAQWFLARGYVVVFALRRGFGASDGDIAESSGSCDAPDYEHAGWEGAGDVAAIVRWAETLPGVRTDATVVIGQSTGGWASLAYAARADARAVAVINMAGGRGGRAFAEPASYCRPERLVKAAARFGASARVPTLWIYASNDSYFGPDVATRMQTAFVQSGGRAALEVTAPFGTEGHRLFYGAGGSEVWGPLVMRFLAEGAPSQRPET